MTDLLDLGPGHGRVVTGVHAEVVTRDLDVIGYVTPQRDALTVTLDTSSAIMRRCNGLSLTRSDYEAINPERDLLRLVVNVAGRPWHLGAFYLTTDDDPIGVDYGLGGPMVDAGLVLSYDTTRSYSLSPGASIVSLIQDVLTDAGFTRLAVTDTGAYTYDPVVFPAGTPRATILRRLADLAAYFPPYFDNDGTLVVRPVDDLDTADAVDYPDQWRMAGPVLTRNLLDAPNVYRVVNNGAPNAEVAAVAYVDPALPWSRENRGFEVVRTVNQQGIRDYGSALRLARSLADRDAVSFAGWSFTSLVDPRHDTFTVVTVNGVAYREVSWSLNLATSEHSHVVARTPATTDGGTSG